MKRKITLMLVAFLCIFQINAQVKIGDNPTVIDSSAILELKSSSKGLLIPRMTQVERNLIVSPATALMIWCSNCGVAGELQLFNGTIWTNSCGGTASASLPSLTTATVASITVTSAVSGGNISYDGGATVTARGVCWNTSANPTTGLSTKTTNGAGTGVFTSNINGLAGGTTYYVRAYATNSLGTAYGNELSFTTNPVPLAIGQTYQGGIIAYILQPGDPGYVAGQTHGLIAASTDQSSAAAWGCQGTAISGADGNLLGTGMQNTIDITNGCTEAGTAAKICSDLVLNGYSDWYLPSLDELHKLYLNKALIAGLANNNYWSSTEFSANYAWYEYFYNGGQSTSSRYVPYNVRAVRSF